MSENLDSIIQSTKRLVTRARLRLFWESYAPTLAPGFLALALFSLGAWLGIWQWIGDPVRLIALVITLFFLIRSILRAVQLRMPTYSDARRRVELDSKHGLKTSQIPQSSTRETGFISDRFLLFALHCACPIAVERYLYGWILI